MKAYRRSTERARCVDGRTDAFLSRGSGVSGRSESCTCFPVVPSLRGESLEEAVRRELQEEVGLWPGTLEHLGAVLADNRRSSARIHIYLATDLENRSLPADASEVIAWEWLSEAEIEAAIAREEYEHAHLLAGWAMYKARRVVGAPHDSQTL